MAAGTYLTNQARADGLVDVKAVAAYLYVDPSWVSNAHADELGARRLELSPIRRVPDGKS